MSSKAAGVDPAPEDPQAFPARLLVPVFLLVAAFMAGFALAPANSTRAFDEASAQIIPVLVLTLAIEARAFEWNLPPRDLAAWWWEGLSGRLLAAGTRVLVLGVLIAAELVTLHRLADTDAPTESPEFAYAAMLTGFVAVGLAAVPRRGPRP